MHFLLTFGISYLLSFICLTISGNYPTYSDNCLDNSAFTLGY